MESKRPYVRDFESLGQYHDFFVNVTQRAPNQFSSFSGPVDQEQAMHDAFESLQKGLQKARSKIKDARQMRILSELIEMGKEFFLKKDETLARRALQECGALIWTSTSVRLELVAIAEHRAFGEISTYQNVKPRKYDGFGSYSDLGRGQRKLFDFAFELALEKIPSVGLDFKLPPHVVTSSGDLRAINRASHRKNRLELHRLVDAQEIDALLIADFYGVLIFHLEERGQPFVSARAKWNGEKISDFIFILDDPEFFSLE